MADKIKRAFTWLRKALVITEKTTAPGALLDDIQSVLDVFGWERLNETTNLTTVAVNASTVNSPAVPEDVLRVIISANVETNDAGGPFTFWMDHLDGASNINVGVMRPITPPSSVISIRNAREGPYLVLRPTDVLAGRASPAIVGNLTLRQRFVDLPIGEYIRAL